MGSPTCLQHGIPPQEVLKYMSTDFAHAPPTWHPPLPLEPPGPKEVQDFWDQAHILAEFPSLTPLAHQFIWFPVSGADVERSFGKLKRLVAPTRHCLTEESTKELTMLNYNGDIEHRLD